MSTENIYSKREARKLVRSSNSKIAVQVGFDGPFVFVEKADFVKQILKGRNFTSDGTKSPVIWDEEDRILYIPLGVN